VTTIDDQALVSKLYDQKRIGLNVADERIKGVVNNSFVAGSGALAFATKHPDSDEVRLELVDREVEAFGLKATAHNKEQIFALNLLMNPDIKVVSLGGKAGTGKTLLALMAGLDHVMEKPGSGHEKVTVFRPVQAVGGQDLGYLPGTAEEKMAPWEQAVWDSIESEVSSDVIAEIKDRGHVEVLPLTHIRGRSLHKRWVIVDEAQNLDLPSILAVLTRTGKNTKVILNWDESQRDNPHVSRYNGIVEAVNRMHGHPLFGHITLTKSERSPVAAMAGVLLDN
jgi:PhoH-like ATPase